MRSSFILVPFVSLLKMQPAPQLREALHNAPNVNELVTEATEPHRMHRRGGVPDARAARCAGGSPPPPWPWLGDALDERLCDLCAAQGALCDLCGGLFFATGMPNLPACIFVLNPALRNPLRHQADFWAQAR